MAKRNPFAAIAHGHDLAEAIVPFGSRHKHCRGLGASAEGDGRENEWASGHHGDDHRNRNHRWRSDWR
jgi:hypothetical protein